MASSSHKKWEREIPDPAWSGQRNKTAVQEMQVYPRSRGRILQHLGEDFEMAVDLMVDHKVDEIRAFKLQFR